MLAVGFKAVEDAVDFEDGDVARQDFDGSDAALDELIFRANFDPQAAISENDFFPANKATGGANGTMNSKQVKKITRRRMTPSLPSDNSMFDNWLPDAPEFVLEV